MKNPIIPQIITVLFVWMAAYVSYGQQDSIALKEDQAVSKSLLQHKDVQLSTMDKSIAKAQYQQTNQTYLPQISASYNALTTNNPLYAFGLKLQQQNIQMSDFNPSILNHPDNTTNFQTAINLQQPLLNVDAFYMRKAMHSMYEMQELKLERMKEYITFQTRAHYAKMILLNNSVQTWKAAVQLSSSILENMKSRSQQGYVQKADLLNAQVQHMTMQNALTEAESEYKNACDQISVWMGEPLGTIYSLEMRKEVIIDSISTFCSIDQRSDLLAMKKGLDIYQYQSTGYLHKMTPRINAFGSYFLNDNKALGFSSGSYYAGISLQWDIFNGGNSMAQYRMARLEKQKLQVQVNSEIDNSKLEIEKTARQIKDLQLRYQQNKEAVAQSVEALDLMKSRFNLGLASTTDLLYSETQWAQQVLLAQQTQFGLQMAYAYYQFLTTTQK